MKKIISLLIGLIIVFAACVPAFATDSVTLSGNATASNITQGEQLTITYSVSECTLKSMALSFSYDANAFEVVSGKWLMSGTIMADVFKQPNKAVAAFGEETTVNGPVFELVLKAKDTGSTGNSSVSANPEIKISTTVIPSTGASSQVKVVCKTHTFGEWAQATAPNCIETGSEKRTCSACGTEETRNIDALGHNMSEWEITTEATCDANGQRTRKCLTEGCDTVEIEEIKATGHKFDKWAESKEATCTEKGEQKRVCSVCKKEETKAVKALGHDFEDPTIVKEATISTTGLMKGKCKRCDKTTEEVIPCNATDKATGITVEAEKGTFKNGTELDFTEIKETDPEYSEIQKIIGDRGGNITAYNIAFKNNGTAATINGRFTLNMPIPTGMTTDDIAVYFIDDNGVLTEKEFDIVDKKTIDVNATKAGKYIILDTSVDGEDIKDEDQAPETDIKPEKDEEEKENLTTGFEETPARGNLRWFILILIVLVIIIVVIIIILMRRR